MPDKYTGGGFIVEVDWMATPTSGTVGWTVEFERMQAGGHDGDTDSFAAAATIVAVAVPGTSGGVTRSSVTIPAGDAKLDGILKREGFRVRLTRDTALDTAAGDVQMLDLVLREA